MRTGDWWADGPIVAAALLTAWWVIWRRGLRPIIHGFRTLKDVLAGLVGLAHAQALQDRVMADHIIEDRANFAEIRVALRNIEQGQAPHGDGHRADLPHPPSVTS